MSNAELYYEYRNQTEHSIIPMEMHFDNDLNDHTDIETDDDYGGVEHNDDHSDDHSDWD